MKIDKRRKKGISGLNSSFEHPRIHRFRRPEFKESIRPYKPIGLIKQKYGPLGNGEELMPMSSHRFIRMKESLNQYRGYGRPKKQRTSSY